MEEAKFKAIRISLDDGKTWVDIKPSKYESWLQEPIHATGGWGNPINIPNDQEVSK